jgi:hypothetical protein
VANEFRTEITADRTQFDAAMEGMAQKAMTESQRMQSSMREAFTQVGTAAGESFKKMNTQFDAMKEGIKAIRGALAAVAAVVAGGAMFTKAITQSAELTEESRKLATMLGVTLEAASALRIAISDSELTTDDYTSMVSKLTMKLREGEDRFNELGIKTRGANGELLDTERITGNALAALQNFKEGTDRNLASTELFGKGWDRVNKLLRITPEAMEEARQKAVALELQIGPEGAKRLRQYEMAMNDLKDVGEALANRIGQALMPVLTDMGNWLAGMGPAAVTVLRGALGGLLTMVYAVQNGIVVMVRLVSAALYTVIEPLAAIAEASALAVTGNFAAAGARLKQIPENISARWKEEFDEILKSGDLTRERIAALFDPAAEQGASQGGAKAGKAFTPKKDTDKSRMSGWEAELAAQRDAYDKQMLEQGSFQQFTLAMERDFWKRILDTVAMTAEERVAASKKYYSAERELRKVAFEAEIAELKERLERHKQGSIERVRLAGESAARIGEKYGLESKEYKQALGEMSKMAEERGKQRQQLEEMALERTKEAKVSVIELERQALDDAEKLGIVSTKNKLARLKELKELEFQIELQALTDTAAIYEMDAIAYQQHLDKLAKLKETHAAGVRKLDGQVALESKKSFDTWFDPIGNGFQKLMDGMIQGTQTWHGAIRKTLLAVGAEFLSLGVKLAVNWVKTELLKTQATVAGTAARTAAETAGAGQSVLVAAWTAIKTIGIKAWEAAASVYAAIASIPVVGPFLAPAMAVAAAGTVMSFVGRIASAEGGFDVPRGLNPVTQLHEKEMVLPAHLAETVRAMAGAAGSGAGGGDIYLNVNAVDGASVRRLFMDHGSALSDALRRQARNFTPIKPQ